MKYCSFCKRLNSGRPKICMYCGRSWHQRLCSRGHENPSDAQYCGTCGSTELTETVGPRSWRARLLLVLVVALLGAILVYIFYYPPLFLSKSAEALRCFLLDNAVTIILLGILWYLLPGFIKKPLKAVLGLLVRAGRLILISVFQVLRFVFIGRKKKSSRG